MQEGFEQAMTSCT